MVVPPAGYCAMMTHWCSRAYWCAASNLAAPDELASGFAFVPTLRDLVGTIAAIRTGGAAVSDR